MKTEQSYDDLVRTRLKVHKGLTEELLKDYWKLKGRTDEEGKKLLSEVSYALGTS